MDYVLECQTQDAAVFLAGDTRLRVQALSPHCLRVTETTRPEFLLKAEPMIEDAAPQPGAELRVQESAQGFALCAGMLTARLSHTGALSYEAEGIPLTREPKSDGRMLRPIDILRYRFDPDAPIVEQMSVDGARARAEGTPYVDRQGYQTRLNFVFTEEEALYGLGQHEEGVLNYRGGHQLLYQHNLKVSCPVLFSSRGWAILYNSAAAMTFHDDAFGSYLSSDADAEMDFFFLYGPEFDAIVAHLRHLTGRASMLPKWALGYVQSKEHYHTQQELVDIVREYRRLNVPLDVIVQDWYTWPEGLWGQKTVDKERYPDLRAAADEIHALHAHLMWSIWPNMSGDGPNRAEFLRAGLLLGNRSTYDAFDQQARAMYWGQANDGLFSQGVDAWWCDCTEPFEADWFGPSPMTPEDRMQFDVAEFKTYLDPASINAYSLYHSRGIYEGQRAAAPNRRVLNLTRSGFPGQQKYGTITWNGDTSARWDVMSRSIVDGLNFCLSGQPYWTMDVGGFFVKRWAQWFGRGEYEQGIDDPAYRELFVRWFQLGTFLPMLRAHGTDTPREIWRFGESGDPAYEAILAMIHLRMRLLPYLYSLVADAHFAHGTMLRMMAFDFRTDPVARTLADQFMLGRALMVCPVTGPGERGRRVYLPEGFWYDFWTGERLEGGRWIEVAAPIDSIPLFVPAGSILPLGPVVQYALQPTEEPLEIKVYPGRDAEFALYNDAGDGYDFEAGAYARVIYHWSEAKKALSEQREGDARYLPNTAINIVGGPFHDAE